jgi:hypothetical protein
MTAHDLAFAYELRNCGIAWKRIGAVFGRSGDAVRCSVRYAEKNGIPRQRYSVGAKRAKNTV